MHYYLKFSCSLAFTGLLFTACQKETLVTPGQSAPMASTSVRPSAPPPPPPPGQSNGSGRVTKGIFKSKKTIIDGPNGPSSETIMKNKNYIWNPNGEFQKTTIKQVLNQDSRGTQYDKKMTSRQSVYVANVRSPSPGTSGVGTPQRPK